MRNYSSEHRRYLALIAISSLLLGAAPEPKRDRFKGRLDQDITALCITVPQSYVYFAVRASNWPIVCRQALAKAPLARSFDERLAVLETMIDALYDTHVHLGTNSSTSHRLVPYGADYWLEDGKVTAVRSGSGAAIAGLLVGDHVVALNGEPLDTVAKKRVEPKGVRPSPAQLRWAVNAAAAGRRGQARRVSVLRNGRRLNLTIADPTPAEASAGPVTGRMLKGDIGHVRINDWLYEDATVAAFDAVMDDLKGAKAWILDLRDTPSGGHTGVAEPIIGHFLTREGAYQELIPIRSAAWRSVAKPRRWAASGPLAVLVGRWTGSMGEGIAIGLDGLGRGHVIGTEMSRLAGAMEDFKLPASGITYRLSVANIRHVNGTDRHDYTPRHRARTDNGNGPDLGIVAARAWIKRKASTELERSRFTTLINASPKHVDHSPLRRSRLQVQHVRHAPDTKRAGRFRPASNSLACDNRSRLLKNSKRTPKQVRRPNLAEC